MTTRYTRVLSALFCLFLGGLLLVHITLPDRAWSDVENRTLEQRPEFSWDALVDGSYTKDVESYFADQFPLRDGWTGMKARMEQLIGKRNFHDVYLCGDTLISQVLQPNQEQVDKNLSYIDRLQEKTEIPVHVGFIPSAAEIWKDKLPSGAGSWDQSAFLQQVDSMGFDSLDLKTALESHAEEPIFYRTDHHWTTLGAFYGANAILDSLGKEPLDRSEFTPEVASDAFNGTLYSTSGVHWLPSDTMEYWVREEGLEVLSWRSGKPTEASLYDRDYLNKKDKYSSFLGGNQPLCVIKNPEVTDGSKILLVRDSYADSLAPFLAQRFAEVHLMDLRTYHSSVSLYAEQQGIHDILVLYSIPNFIAEKNVVFLAQ